jgi:hypothetical protein
MYDKGRKKKNITEGNNAIFQQTDVGYNLSFWVERVQLIM